MKQISFSKHHTDILKIYFILTVTVFHIWRYVYKMPILPGYGVVGFFIISGYGCYISLQNKPFKTFLKSRLYYITPPYYIALLFYSIAHFFFGFYNTHVPLHRDILGLITHILFIHNISGYTQWTISGVLWFIAVIVQLYFLSDYLKKMVDLRIKTALSLIAIIFIAEFLVQHFFRIENLYFFKGWHLIYLSPYLLGMCLAKYREFLLAWINQKLQNKLLLAVYFLITAFLTYFTLYSKDIATMTFIVVFSLPLLLLACNIVAGIIPEKTINFLGTFSFFLYLYNYTFYIFQSGSKSPEIQIISAFAAIFITAYCFYLVNKKVNLKRED